MKTIDAMAIISGHESKGYMVHFEWKEGRMLRSDYFPELDESLIETEEQAWAMAKRFADATKGRCVNIYVVNDKYSPVPGYKEREIENR